MNTPKPVPSRDCHGRSERSAAAAVNMIGAVSPATRVIPNTEAVRIPGRAYGSTAVRIDCHLVAPSASEASRKPLGTARSDSSHDVTMTGSTMMARVKPPASIQVPQPWKER